MCAPVEYYKNYESTVNQVCRAANSVRRRHTHFMEPENAAFMYP